MSVSVQIRDLQVRYGRTTALDGVSVDIAPGTITGLLGRNGSGKTTLLSTIAAFRRPSAGSILIDGEDPWENTRVMARTCLIRESGDLPTSFSMAQGLALLAGARPTFDPELAGRLMDTFELDERRTLGTLSRGKRSAFGAVAGLASRTELTMFDEVYLGMDAPSRYAFYDALLADYVEHPRTIILSSHLIDEIASLLENVVILDRGGVLLAEAAESLRARGVSVTGPADVVDAFTADREVAARLGLELGPVDLQSLFVHLTEKEPVR